MSLIESVQYAVEEFGENWDDRMWWRHRIGARIIGPFQTTIYPRRIGSTYVLEEDWDVLIVLDACRADLFEAGVDTGRFDSYRRVTSPGSRTPEWALQNFGGEELGDTVYISSNGWVSSVLDSTFHEIISVWEDTDGPPHPDDITEAAIEAHKQYPNKRLVVHYLQPHRPFIESTVGFDEGYTDNPWSALGNGEIDRETIWDLYLENLDAVIDDASALAEDLPGRVVITSDHGNLLGERTYPVPIRLFGHPEGVRHPGLVEVPWAVLNSDDRPEIVAEETTESDDADRSVQEHLRDLGYVE